MWGAAKEYFFRKSKENVPMDSIPSIKFETEGLKHLNSDDFSITWFGHSTVLIYTNGISILTDPMFNSRVQPLNMGPKAFKGSNNLVVDSLPKIDVVLISHDHYDHLDYNSITTIKALRYIVPLGVKSYLVKWGIPSEKITELDWYEELRFSGNVKFTATPSQHFSGRGLFNRMSTLWCGYVIQLNNRKIYFSGDSGYSNEFKKIGEKFGPFDLAMLDNGQYNKNWAKIHMMPEEAVQAAIDLKASLFLPIHWGKYSLSVHSWYEPIERATKEAASRGIKIITPMIGESFLLGKSTPERKWWNSEDIPLNVQELNSQNKRL
jgi:L-ascorbate metabolism protein UlaG (beta-lactamase superfamily)